MRVALLSTAAVGCSWLAGAGTPVADKVVPLDLDGVKVELRAVASGFDRPLLAIGAGDGGGRIFVVEQGGRIYAIQGEQRELWLDHSATVSRAANEQGLLGLAFAPDFKESGRFYLSYTTPGGGPAGRSILSRMQVDRATGRPDPTSEQVLLQVPQPAGNHNGGHVTFGPDGMLYLGLGDGGGAGDRYKTSRDPSTLLAKLIRVDVSGEPSPGKAYRIPPDNPFASGGGAPEIWALGLRNPWRFAFDPQTRDLWIADVGQNKYEEIHVAPSRIGGIDYGWNVLEGTHCFAPASGCDKAGLALPLVEYDHGEGCSVTGGEVYRGRAIPKLQGTYLAADYCTGNVWTAKVGAWPDGTDGPRAAAVLDPRPHGSGRLAAKVPGNISSFGLDDDGELLVVDHRGVVYRLAPAPEP